MTKHNLTIADEYSHLKSFIESLPANFETTGEMVYDGRNMVRRFVAPDGTVLIVKRYKVPNIFQRISTSTYRPSKARRAFDYAKRLLKLDIDTPKPIACIEISRCGLFKQGYFVSTEDKNPSCEKIFANPSLDPNGNLRKTLPMFIAKMHKTGFLHGDINLSNILCDVKDGEYTFSVIDINRSSFVEEPTKKQCLDNLMRLTHDRELLGDIISVYAQERGWNPEECTKYVNGLIDTFERRKIFKYKLLGRKITW